MGRQVRAGVLRAYLPNVIEYLGEEDPFAGVGQFVSNSVKAESPLIRVDLQPKVIGIHDSGNGMLPLMYDEDRQAGDLLFEANTAMTVDELRRKVSVFSAHTLEWAAQFIGLSRSVVFDERGSQGLKAIGLLAYQALGKSMTIYSRPCPEYAKPYFGREYERIEDIPTHMLVFPPQDTLSRSLKWSINESGPLADPWDKPAKTSGTSVIIGNLHDNVLDGFHPTELAKFLGRMYSEYIDAGGRIEVIDRITQESTQFQGGRIIAAQSPKQTIPPIIDKDFRTEKGDVFHATIYHDPTARGSGIQLKCFKETDITQLVKFQHDPWLDKSFFGTITFPRYPASRELRIWDQKKSFPNQTAPERVYWERAVLDQIEPALAAHLTRIRQHTSNKITQKLEPLLTDAVRRAVRESSIGGLNVPNVAPPIRGFSVRIKPGESLVVAGGKAGEKRKTRGIRASAMDERHQGRAGIEFILWRSGVQVGREMTESGGHANFGPVPNGKYQIEIVVPETILVKGDKKVNLEEITDSHPREEPIFHIVTGEKSIRTRLAKVTFQPRFVALPNPDELWRIRLVNGVFVGWDINVLGKHLKSALDSRNYDVIALLCAVYSASALCAHHGKGSIVDIMLEQDDLAFEIYCILRQGFTRNLKRLAEKR